MNTASRVARIIVLLTLAVALAGCSAIKLGYNTLGEVAYWWLDSYIDFAQRVVAELDRAAAGQRRRDGQQHDNPCQS